jgi:hypothetical protein
MNFFQCRVKLGIEKDRVTQNEKTTIFSLSVEEIIFITLMSIEMNKNLTAKQHPWQTNIILTI